MDIAHKRTYTALKIHAFRHHGYLGDRQLETLQLPTTPDVLETVLSHLQAEGLVRVQPSDRGEHIYDFLPLLEQAGAENILDPAIHYQLAQMYIERQMWTHAIAELRLTSTNPKYRKESLYHLGGCFEKKGALERAKEHYERLLASDYFYLDTLDRLTTLQRQHNQATAIIPAAALSPTSSEPFPPDMLERYEIVREIGCGAAGVVYQAIDLKLKRDVALKVLYPQTAPAQENVLNFLHEARVIAQLNHPNIIHIYDVNVEARCLAMEFVAGGTLRDLLQPHGRLPAALARSIIIQLCRALQAAHGAGVLHRDIKPANIFVTKQRKIKLGDFGIARLATLDQNALTQLSVQIGTLPYMSPEQVRGEPLEVTSDIYAVGVVWYEMLTGAPPFIRGDLAYHHVYSEPPPPGISASIDALILKCLAKRPAERFQTIGEFLRTLQQYAQDEQERCEKYRNLLKVALLDHNLSASELRVLQLKRKAFGLSEEEARQIEQEAGISLPS